MFIVPSSRETRQFHRVFDDAFVVGSAALEGVASRSPALDVVEGERAYTVKLEMPGVAKQDVRVSIEGRQVSVQAQAQAQDERKEGERLVYRERPVASFARSFSLPSEVDQTESGAKLEHGVLTLTLPKRSARRAAQITVM
jgi:HSP20 family protein